MWDRFHFRGTMVPILGPVQNLEPQNRFSGPVLPSLNYSNDNEWQQPIVKRK